MFGVTKAEQARDLAARGFEPPEIAKRLGMSRQAVHAALKRTTSTPGPKVKPHTVCTCRVCGRKWKAMEG